MIRDALRSRSFLAAIGFVALVGVLGASVASVQALSPQEQEEETARAGASQYRQAVEKALAAAKLAMATGMPQAKLRLAQARELQRGRLHGVQERLHAVQERWHEARERGPQRFNVRRRGGPNVQIRMLGGRGGGSARSILAQAEELGLSEDQIAQLRQARDGARRATIERDAAIEVGELDLHGLLEDEDSADLGAVEAQMRKISALRVDARIAALRLQRTVGAVLTPEQSEQLEEMEPHVFIRRGGAGPGAMFFGDGDEVFDFSFGGELDFGNLFEFDAEDPDSNGMIWEYRDGHEDDEDADIEKKKKAEKEKQEKQGKQGVSINV